MRRLLLLLSLLLLSFQAYAQDSIVVSDTLDGWDYGWISSINGSQASYSNWAQGGVNNISATGSSQFRAHFRESRFSYAFLIDTRYGQTKIEDEGTRKTDDLLLIRNRFTYDLNENNSDFSLYGSLDFRSQFDDGFEYDAGPNDEDLLISGFLSPAYISENIGLSFVPDDHLSFEAGLGLRQTVVRDTDLSTTYGLDEGDTFRNEAGLNLGAAYQQNVATNLVLRSSLDTFTNISEALSSTDIFFSNEIVGRINNFMNTTVRLDLVFDDDFSEELQVRQSLTLGVSFVLI